MQAQVSRGVTTASKTAARRRWNPLIEKLEASQGLIGIIGLGYVGLPVAAAFGDAGFHVLGVDADRDRVQTIMAGRSYIHDVPGDRLARLRAARRLKVSSSYRGLAAADAVLICVPTPLAEGAPDLSPIKAAGERLSRWLTPDTLVVLESTTYPGTTEEFLCPLLEANGLKVKTDFLLAYSPERIDPGNPLYGFEDIPKVAGGIDAPSTRAAEALYGRVVPKVMTVPGTREAEMAKLIENTFRHVNIGLVNELATYAHEWGVDIWEAIGAAATKPFGFEPFWPSAGWGGHCIPLDPSYLSWRVRREHSHDMRFVELAHTVNAEMPRHVVRRIGSLLNKRGKAIQGSRILAVGVAYKGGTEDTRGSPGVKVLSALTAEGAKVTYHDPLVPEIDVTGKTLRSCPLSRRTLKEQDVVVALVAQEQVDWELIRDVSPLVFDCCNALKRSSGRVARL